MFEKTFDSIEHANVMIDYYKSLEDAEDDTKKKANFTLKRQQLEDSRAENQKFVAFIVSL